MGYYNECSMDDPNEELFSDEGWHVADRPATDLPPPTDSFIAQALEEFVTDTSNLLSAAHEQKPLDKDEIAYWTRQRNAFVKAQRYFADGVRLTRTPSAYLAPSASLPGSLIHRLYQAGDIWICPCEARVFCWHHALLHAYERGAGLEALAEDEAERRLSRMIAAARARCLAA